ncbi:MAG: ABC transporter permease [Bacillota bacterium]
MKRWVVFVAVFKKTLVEMRRYLFNMVSGLVSMYLIFLLLFFGAKAVGGSAFQTGGHLEGLIVGYTIWILSLLAYQDLAWQIASDAEIGTLEQLYLSPAGFGWVNASHMAARFVVNMVIISLILFVMMLTTGRWLHLDLISLVPLLVLTVIPCYGLGFLMGGLALVFKRIQSSFQILQFVFVALIAAPMSQFPWIKYLPLAMGNSLLREVMVEGARLWQMSASDLGLATAVGVGYLALGYGGFAYLLNVARDRGLMGHY